MNRRTVLGASLAALLLAGGLLADEALKSGLQPGEGGINPFNPLHINGPDAGKKVCLV
jgi:hypothetical protein